MKTSIDHITIILTTSILLCGPIAAATVIAAVTILTETSIWLSVLTTTAINTLSAGTYILLPIWLLLLTSVYLPAMSIYILTILSSLPTVLDLISNVRTAPLLMTTAILLGSLTTVLGIITSWHTATIIYASAAYVGILGLLLTAGISTYAASLLVPHALINKILPVVIISHTIGWRITTDASTLLILCLLLRTSMTIKEEIIYISAAVTPTYVISTIDMSTYTELDTLTSYLILASLLAASTERQHSNIYTWSSTILLYLTWAGIPTILLSLLKLSWLSSAGNSSWQPWQLTSTILILHRYLRCLLLILFTEATNTDDLYRFWH